MVFIDSEKILSSFHKSTKINYDVILQKMIASWTSQEERPNVLIHTCCAPCSTYTLEYLTQYANITIYFANPNIHPKSEYNRRLYEQQHFIIDFNRETKNTVQFIGEEYNPDEFIQKVAKNLESIPEGGERCKRCFGYRLDIAAKKAAEHNFDYFGSALTISPMKNAQVINGLGIEVQQFYDVKYLPSDFKKNNGYKRSIEMCEYYDIYRQCYCGCIFAAKQQGIDIKEVDKKAKEFMKTSSPLQTEAIKFKKL